jgi:hypothetical protein
VSWPNITWTGELIKRRVAEYGGAWYAEYAVWEVTSGAAFTVGGAVSADVFMISPGLTGSAGSTAGGGMGGGAGAPFTWEDAALPAGDYTIEISAAKTELSGTDITTMTATTPTGGATAGTAYALYGDADHTYGAAGSKGSPTSVAPGIGAAGCTFLPVRAATTVFGSSSSRVSLAQGAAGVGAGGNGGGRTDYMASALQTLSGPGAGAVGMVLFRVAL